MNGFIGNIAKLSQENENFRKVLYTTPNSQLVLMSLKPGEEIGAEVHPLDQFIRCEAGEGMATVGGLEHRVFADIAIVVPAGTNHNVINNSGRESLKLYAIYSPPDHRDGVIHETKSDATKDTDDRFDGTTTE